MSAFTSFVRPDFRRARLLNVKRAAVCVILLSLISCSVLSARTPKLPVRLLTIKTASGKTVSVNAEIADTEQTRANGFMFRKNIPDGTGMLFVYQHDLIMNFWMKNTPTPLSIAYIDSAGRIKDIFDMTPYSLADVTSTGYCRYALEVPQGWFKRSGISKGDVLVLDF